MNSVIIYQQTDFYKDKSLTSVKLRNELEKLDLMIKKHYKDCFFMIGGILITLLFSVLVNLFFIPLFVQIIIGIGSIVILFGKTANLNVISLVKGHSMRSYPTYHIHASHRDKSSELNKIAEKTLIPDVAFVDLNYVSRLSPTLVKVSSCSYNIN